MRVPFALLVAALVSSCAATDSNLYGRLVVMDSYTAPTCATSTAEGDLCVADAIEGNGALDIAGASTLTGAVTMGSTLGITGALAPSGGFNPGITAVTDTATLTAADCGSLITVSAGIDTKTITLPATVAGCEYKFNYIGADGGALVDISPDADDAIHGSCTLAASVVEFSGTDNADIGLTKATANTGDTITIIGDGGEGWYVTACAGIWANN